LLADAVAEALRVGGPLAGALAGFEPRPGQAAMAARVADAIDNDERLLVEAGTGTGKTLAYLLPAILSGRKVVVSTGTKTLQDQIARIDLPRLAAALTPFTFTVMKGLSNYLCLRRFHEHSQQTVLGLGEVDPLARVRAWIDETTTGDRADLTDLPEDAPLWREITATPETRLGARCPYFERCFVTGMRRRAAEAQIVLTNHHLFFADLALRARWPEVQVLPPYEAVIFDEAHQLEEVATEFFGLHVSSLRMHALARDIGRASVPAAHLARGTSLSRRLQAAADAFAESLRARLPAPRLHTEEVRVPVPEDLWTARSHTLARYHELDTVLEDGAAFFDGLSEATNQPMYGGLARRAAALRGELGQMIEGPGGGTLVRWRPSTSGRSSSSASRRTRGRWSSRRPPSARRAASSTCASGWGWATRLRTPPSPRPSATPDRP
jgi:ATP-dependent DNA helicase DinG